MSFVANTESSQAPQKNGKQLEYKQVELSAISAFDPAVAELARLSGCRTAVILGLSRWHRCLGFENDQGNLEP